MPPIIKLAKQKHKSKGKKGCIICPYCGFHHCWKHGKYKRKGFHQFPSDSQNKILEVLRYLCRSPACEHTFSVLPDDVLPYCRFFLSGLIGIAEDRSEGKSAYWIAKYRWNLSLRAILRAVKRIRQVTPWLERLFREATGVVVKSFQGLIKNVRERLTWFVFTRYWYHQFYLCRIGYILNPHNLCIKRL